MHTCLINDLIQFNYIVFEICMYTRVQGTGMKIWNGKFGV
jgi:hypothetical protein